jgi:hypothetical protein
MRPEDETHVASFVAAMGAVVIPSPGSEVRLIDMHCACLDYLAVRGLHKVPMGPFERLVKSVGLDVNRVRTAEGKKDRIVRGVRLR